MKAALALPVPQHGCASIPTTARGKVEMLSSTTKGQKILELAYHIKPEKFAHLLVPNDAPVVEAQDDEGIDVNDPVQRAASVESVVPSEPKAVDPNTFAAEAAKADAVFRRR